MTTPSKIDLINKIKSEYNNRLKDLEAKLAKKHNQLKQIENQIAHESKKIEHSHISKFKSKKSELNNDIMILKKEIKKINKEKIKKLRKL
ncbi:MAG: hypothetical protein ACFE9T_13470 [Promethearchaeota archaeon]